MAVNFFSKLVLDLLIFMAFVALWRVLSEKEKIQTCLNSLPFPFNLLFQWYSVLILGFLGAFIEAFGNIMLYDYIGYSFLDPDVLSERLDVLIRNGDLTKAKKAELTMPSWLRYVSLASPIFGMAAVVVVTNHLFMIIKQGYQRKLEAGYKYLWEIQGRQAMYLIVVAVPLVFIAMSVRSTSRIWIIMTGSSYGEDTVTNLALFKENFELVSMCQYYTVFVFTQLCLSFLNEQHATEEIKLAMASVGFLGAYAWCFFSMLHSILVFGIVYSRIDQYSHDWKLLCNYMEAKVASWVQVTSWLASYNMGKVCKLKSVEAGIPGAALKLKGTQFLLIVAPNQMWLLENLKMSDECTMVLHSSLISIEMLGLALFNFIAWEKCGKSDSIVNRELDSYFALKGAAVVQTLL